MDDIMVTPVVRAGPSSKLMRMQSRLPEPKTTKEATLERSLQLLDRALESPVQTSGDRVLDVTSTANITRMHDMTLAVNRSLLGKASYKPLDISLNNSINSALMEENPGVKGTENLFNEFLLIVSTGAAGLDKIAEFEQLVGDHIHALRRVVVDLGQSKDKFPNTVSVLRDLINERNTWRIMGKLYSDRLVKCAQAPPDLPPPSPGSEKHIIERLFINNAEVRQAYMVVEWLEKNAQDQNEQTIRQQMEWFTDATICWENTTAALARGQSGPNMVKELDPDAPNRTGLQLHDLDQQDEARLASCVYGLVRCGQLEEAQELCVRLGQPWKAATLEGWKLFHDPNYNSGTDGNGDKLPIEGNVYRDIWKKVAWGLTTDSSLAQDERATYAALCGNLEQLRSVTQTWEDRLWAGTKCAVDVMVETEIRDNLIKNFAELPTEYWNTPISMSKILKEAETPELKYTTEEIYRTIQSNVIVDDYAGLVAIAADEWLPAGRLPPHLLRLLAHLVLVNRWLGIAAATASEDLLLEAYTKYLMHKDQLDILPWYVARLNSEVQVPLYSQYLAGVTDSEDQALCLYLGSEVGLDMKSLVVAAVTSIRASTDSDASAMVASLGWLSHDRGQAADLLYQANAVIRRLLALGQIELASQAARNIPKETLNRVVRAWREKASDEELPGGSVRQFLALKVYLDAQDAFSDWFDHFHRGQPKRPVLGDNPTFTEKVAHEQREKQYYAELDRWRGGQVIQSRQAEEKLKVVLNFPGGWLTDLQDKECDAMDDDVMETEHAKRKEEMDNLRSEILPQTVLLLHSVLHNTGQYKACVSLANLVVEEHTRNYTAFTKEKIKQILAKIRESCLAVVDEGKDAWGFPKP